MPKYNVKYKLNGGESSKEIEANSPEEAIKKMEKLNFARSFHKGICGPATLVKDSKDVKIVGPNGKEWQPPISENAKKSFGSMDLKKANELAKHYTEQLNKAKAEYKKKPNEMLVKEIATHEARLKLTNQRISELKKQGAKDSVSIEARAKTAADAWNGKVSKE